MSDYKPFLIQKLKEGSPVIDSMQWGMWIKHIPFKLASKAKNVSTETWKDEHGDDEYVPNEVYMEAYEIKCDFYYIGEYESANDYINSFLSYIRNGGAFKIYDTYTKIGRTDVRYVDFDDDAFHRREGQDDVVLFSVTLKVNNPIDDIVLVL